MNKVKDTPLSQGKNDSLGVTGRFCLMADSLFECFALLNEEGRLMYANKKLCALLGYATEQLVGKSAFDFVDDENRDILSLQIEQRKDGVQSSYEVVLTGARGESIYALVLSTPFFDDTGVFRGSYAILTNIRSEDEEKNNGGLALLGSCSALDLHVQEKTEELKRAELKLRKKVLAHDRIEGSLAMMEDLLAQKNSELLLANEALRELLSQGSESIAELERKMFSNLQLMVFPYLKKLKKHSQNKQSLLLLDVICANLEKISSSFSQKLSSHLKDVTPREIEVAEFVKLGKTTKEISSLLAISSRTVESYRDSLRVKLNIKNKKINLRSYLASIL